MVIIMISKFIQTQFSHKIIANIQSIYKATKIKAYIQEEFQENPQLLTDAGVRFNVSKWKIATFTNHDVNLKIKDQFSKTFDRPRNPSLCSPCSLFFPLYSNHENALSCWSRVLKARPVLQKQKGAFGSATQTWLLCTHI